MKKNILLFLFLITSLSMYSQEEWNQLFSVEANDWAEGDSLGTSSAIADTVAVFGAPGKDSVGAVYVFRGEDDVWEEIQKLTASDADTLDNFGTSVDMTDTIIVVGAPYEDHDSDGNDELANAGSVYIFKYNSSTDEWEEFQKITASTRYAGDLFGYSVEISGTDIIVGAPYHDYNTSDADSLGNAGAAYIYRFNDSEWVIRNKIVASDRAEGDLFGYDVGISGSYAVVGAPYQDVSDYGAAYLFEKSFTGWSQQRKFTAATQNTKDLYGYAVRLNDDDLIIGAPQIGGSSTFTGYVEYYYLSSIWSLKSVITRTDINSSDYFGYSLALSDDYIAIGSRNWSSDYGGYDCGEIFIYSINSSGDTAYVSHVGNNEAYEEFGHSIDISGQFIAAGRPYTRYGYTYWRIGEGVIVTNKPVFTKHPYPERWYNKCGDANGYFVVEAENYNSMMWQVSDDNGNTWVDIDSNLSNYSQYAYEQTEALFIDPLIGLNRNRYRCKITNDIGTTFSNFGAIYFSYTAPYLGTKDTTVYLDETGNISITPIFVVDSTSDGDGSTCHDMDTTLSVYDFDCSNIGTNVIDVTLTAYNEVSTTEQATVTVIDTISPVISSTHNDTIVYLSSSCEASLPDFTGDISATDNCSGSLTITQSPVAGTSISGALNTVSLSVSDASGNTSVVHFNVAAQDTIPPEITSTHDDVKIDADENCEITLPDYTSSITATDNCDTDLEVTQSPAAGLVYSGSKEITLTVTDDAGNTDEVKFYVRSNDASAPVITSTHNDTILFVDSSCELILPDFTGDVSATDNCNSLKGTGMLNVTQLPAAGTSYALGDVVEVTLTVEDDNFNSSEVKFNVTVSDNTPPEITSTHSDQTVSGDGNCQYTLLDYTGSVTASDNCDASLTITQSPVAGTVITGYADITLTATDDEGNSSDVEFRVTIIDTEDPQLSTKDFTVYLDESGNASVLAADVVESATDNCSLTDTTLSKTAFDCSNAGNTVKIDVTVEDAVGNSVTKTATISVRDTIAPEITSTHNDQSVSGDDNCEYTLPDYTSDVTASDNCDASLTITQLPAAGTVVSGYADITLTVTDDYGNSSDTEFRVTIVDTEDPQLSTKDFTVYLDENGSASVLATDVVESATDNCSLTDTTLSKTTFNCSNAGNTVEIDVTVKDAAGNSTTKTAAITVKDNIAPEIACVADKEITLTAGETAYTVNGNEFDLTDKADNCEIVSIINDYNNKSTLDSASFPEGTNTVKWTVIDKSGNASECTFNVTISKTATTISAVNEDNKISIYPNPTDGKLLIEVAFTEKYQITLTDINGKIILERYENNKISEIDLSGQKYGIYYLTVKYNNQTYVHKIVKQ